MTTETIEPVEVSYSLSGGDFFKKNPDKVLAEPYEASGRFGPVTKYRPKGDATALDMLEQIETPIFIAEGVVDASVVKSVIAEDPDKIPTNEEEQNIEKSIKESEKEIVATETRKKKQKYTSWDEPDEEAIQSFQEVLKQYNPDLTEEEIKVFLWYMNDTGSTWTGQWLNIYNPNKVTTEAETAYTRNWMSRGLLFYFSGQFIPKVLYLSGNLYEKKIRFDAEKQNIVDAYGQDVADAQEKVLNEAFNEVYESRLKLDNPEESQRLRIRPFSEFAKTTMVKNWTMDPQTGESAAFIVPVSHSEKSYGQINWYSKKTSVSRWDANAESREEISLADAFRYWLKHDNERPSLPHQFTWEDIFKFYLDKKAVKNIDKTFLARMRALTKEAGDKFFGKFMAEVISKNDMVKIEQSWNEKYNGSRAVDYDKIPIAFAAAKNYPGNELLDVRPEKREAVGFHSINGSSLTAYGVGYGKTWSAIFSIAQSIENGSCKRPFIVVPNQVYKQFMSELKGILPNRMVYDLYNLSEDYISQLYDEDGNVIAVDEGSISIMTYQGFERIGFKENTQDRMLAQLTDAISMIQEMDPSTKAGAKAGVREKEKLGGIIGRALMRSTVNIEDLGFDFVCFDEAHALKKIFSQVKAKPGKDGRKEKKMYEITAGAPSTRGIKGYFVSSYIQMENAGRNVMLLTATPFTNSPLEVYSMLSLVAYQYLRSIGLSNINDFFDTYIEMSYELVINSKLKPERKQVFKAFDNLTSLQKLVYKFMLHREAGKPDAKGRVIQLIRPDKYVLPYKGRFVNGEFTPASIDEMIDTIIPMTNQQKQMMDDVISYVEGKVSYSSLGAVSQIQGTGFGDTDEDDLDSDETIELNEQDLNDDEKAGVRTLRGVNFARNIALSPYLYEFSGLVAPTPKQYIESSPKLSYIMKCIKSVIDYHKAKGEPISGQIIYMDRGKRYFELVKQYLVKELGFKDHEVGFKDHEVGLIRSGKEGTAEHKEKAKNAFNGMVYDEKTKSYRDLVDKDRMKVIIGTSSIREGMNLQRYTTCMYNAFIDWNPTDQIQFEGRGWRQGNTFGSLRIVMPMMADSMDIFMFQKLEEKTSRINSIWNADGKTNVLPVEEIDPKEQKLALVTNPIVIAELETEEDITKMEEQRSFIEANIQTAHNIADFISTRESFHQDLVKIMEIIAPDKISTSTENMARIFESALTTGKIGEGKEARDVNEVIRASKIEAYSISLVDYRGELSRPYDYGRRKGSLAMLKKAKQSFFDKYNIPETKEAIDDFIQNEKNKIQHITQDISDLKSKDYIERRAAEIDAERKEKKITFASVDERVVEFKKLNYLLSDKREDKPDTAEAFVYEDIEGCPPLTEDGERDISTTAIRKLEKCITMIPQTKSLHFTDDGYTPARQKIHDVIKGKIRAKAKCVTEQKEPIAILTGGVPGSGKTTFLKKYAPFLLKENILTIDADAIREELPEYKGWNSFATHLETRDIYMGLLDEIAQGEPCKFDILWDGTMNKAKNYLPLIGKFKKLGYKIYVIFVQVPPEVSRKRVLERYQQSGRYVPDEVVNEANKAGLKGFNKIKGLVNGYMLVDGITGQVIEKQGEQIIDDRDYFKKEATDKDRVRKIKIKRAEARKRRIRILTLKTK
jgi:predicted kinase